MKKVGLIGAGAVGAYFLWAMADCPEIDFYVIAQGERKARLQNGIRINGQVFLPQVLEPKQAKEKGLDLLLVATKYSGLEEAIQMAGEAAVDSTVIMSLLNGVDSEEKLRSAKVPGCVLTSVMRIASRRIGEEIAFDPARVDGVFFGASDQEDKEKPTAEQDDAEDQNRKPDEKAAVQKVKKIFDLTKVNYTIKEDIVTDMWVKYASNLANNLPQAVLFTDASLYLDSEHGYFIAAKIWEEARQVAASRGITLRKEPLIFTTVPKTSKYSTLQDLEAGRHTEVDMLAGHLIEMARECGMEVPFTEYTYHAIKALEEKADGLIGC